MNTWRKLINPHEWYMQLLRLKSYKEPTSRRGLVLIQIDGLSYPDFQRAAAKRHMPFLSRLLRRKRYQLWPLYSGVPSNTPAFQGEFFFGRKQCVPSFQFRDKTTGKVFTMYDDSAIEIEKRLLQEDEGLISGGTAYSSIFAGGAAESHICASTRDWGSAFKTWNPYSLLVTLMLRPYTVIRGLFLCLAEVILAFIDFFRGLIRGQDIVQEWMFILMRVMSCILIREMATANAQMDIYRGMPVVFINFFGYDEQAHRRGPSTRFAYWSLSGIDNAVKKIWKRALRAKRRHYDVWIYSDHGQEKVTPFSKIAGQTIIQAVQELYHEIHGPAEPPLVTTVGPISQIYFPGPYADDQKKIFAKRLIEKNPCLPFIAMPLESGEIQYLTPKGTYRLPEDAKILLGAHHPYLAEVAEDLEALGRHENHGDLTLYNWSAGMQPISFSSENGAHAGPGPRETQAFALLPATAPLPKLSGQSLKIRDLRQAALIFLEKLKITSPEPFEASL